MASVQRESSHDVVPDSSFLPSVGMTGTSGGESGGPPEATGVTGWAHLKAHSPGHTPFNTDTPSCSCVDTPVTFDLPSPRVLGVGGAEGPAVNGLHRCVA